jgi:hypothetical protein
VNKTGTKTGMMVSPVNGAVCPTGAHPRNTGGKPGRSGRPPSEVREALRKAFDERIPLLASIVDGEPIARTRIPLAQLLPHVACPNCGGQLEPANPGDAVDIEVVSAANPKDRVQAMDVMARYGLGPLKEVSTEQVRDKVGQTIDAVRMRCPPELAARIIDAMRAIWTS